MGSPRVSLTSAHASTGSVRCPDQGACGSCVFLVLCGQTRFSPLPPHHHHNHHHQCCACPQGTRSASGADEIMSEGLEWLAKLVSNDVAYGFPFPPSCPALNGADVHPRWHPGCRSMDISSWMNPPDKRAHGSSALEPCRTAVVQLGRQGIASLQI